jgi:sirohydrochlorin cobaltochelatase
LKKALILIAHGARDPDWALPLRRVYEAVKAQRAEQRVELAFLDFMQPDLHGCAQSLLAEGFGEIVVVPLFLAQGGHLKKDIPEILDELRLHNPQASFELTGPVGEAESVVQAMAAHVLSLTGE